MAPLAPETMAKAKAIVALYPVKRSALIPLCHLAQAQDGWLTPDAMEDIARLLDLTPADVRGTASFYDMLKTEPCGRYLIGVCTNIACMLAGAYEVLEHAEDVLGIAPGGTTPDGLFSLEENECLAGCDAAPCVQVNYRFFGPLSPEGLDQLLANLRAGRLDAEVPPHGVLSRYDRRRPLEAGGPPPAKAGVPAGGGAPVVAATEGTAAGAPPAPAAPAPAPEHPDHVPADHVPAGHLPDGGAPASEPTTDQPPADQASAPPADRPAQPRPGAPSRTRSSALPPRRRPKGDE